MTKVLLVDDDVELSGMMREYLERDGFEVDLVHDGESGVERALSGDYALAVLDVMMPRLNGIEALRKIRMESRLPVLMLTARGDGMDRVIGLELGADDYVPKPCTARELSARIRAILRRVRGESVADTELRTVIAGPLVVWPEQRRAQWQGERLDLTSAEFNLLEVLVRNAGKLVSKQDLSEQALGRPLARYDRSIDVHVSSIRHKLGALPDGRSWIQTVRGMGYQFVKE
ncbi:MAG: response regulator transcription factor [Burkholderiales bacterium]|nr:response regulator transcription factor [Burkholderiales bacterium]